MTLDVDSYIDETKKKISVLPKINKNMIESMLKHLAFTQTEEKTKKIVSRIESIVSPAYTKKILDSKNIVMPFPSKDDSQGDGIPIGKVMSGDVELYDYGLTTENLRENIFSTARSGHGKTSLIFYFVESLIKKKINFIFFDFKQDYRVLARIYPDILVIKWSDLRFNPLTNYPEGMDIKIWHRILLDIYAHSQGLLMATPGFLLDAINELWNTKNGEITFSDLGSFIRNQTQETLKDKEYASVAKNRLSNTNHALDKVINCKYGFEVKDLFSRQVVIEMHPLDFQMSSFLIQSIIMHEFHRRMTNQIRMNRKSALTDEYFLSNFVMLFMDEAHNLQFAGLEDSLVSTELSAPPLDNFFSQSRELLMGTFALTQFPYKIMSSFRHNAGTKIIGNLVQSDLQKNMGESIGLDDSDSKKIGKLEKGQWIVNVAGRTKKPFLLHTPYVKKGDIMAESEMFSRSEQLVAKLLATQNEIEMKMFSKQPYSESKKENPQIPEISKDAWNVLNYIFDNPFAYQKQITDSVGLSGDKIMKIKKILQDKGLVRIVKFPVVDYVQVHYILTPKALDIYQSMRKDANKIKYWKFLSKTHPGFEHRLFQQLLKNMHRDKLGWDVKMEKVMPEGRRVDLYCVHSQTNYRKAIEIETSTRDLENKIRVITDDDVDELVLLYKDEEGVRYAKGKIEKILEKNKIDSEKVWIGLAKDYVKTIIGIIKHSETSRNSSNQSESRHGDDNYQKQFRNSLQKGDENN